MWDLEILGVDLYHVITWIYLCSFLGWLWESTYVSIKEKRLVNRGFVTGPVCTIYGIGAVSVYLVLRPLDGNWILIYIGGVIVATVLEYVTAVIMERLFHTSWWDYSNKKFHFQGRICLGSSIAWGFFSLIMFEVLQPFVEMVVNWFDMQTGKVVLSVVTVIYVVDFTYATMTAIQLGKRLEQMEKTMEELAHYFQETKIYESAAQFIDRLEPYRRSFNRINIKEKMEQYQISLEKRLEKLEAAEQKEAALGKLKQLGDKFNSAFNKSGWNSRRLFRAYPNLSKASKLKRMSLKELKNKKKQNKGEEGMKNGTTDI